MIAAPSSLQKGGVIAIILIHLDRIPEFNYDRFLWGERQIRSVVNMTRSEFSLNDANEALLAVKRDHIDGAAIIATKP